MAVARSRAVSTSTSPESDGSSIDTFGTSIGCGARAGAAATARSTCEGGEASDDTGSDETLLGDDDSIGAAKVRAAATGTQAFGIVSSIVSAAPPPLLIGCPSSWPRTLECEACGAASTTCISGDCSRCAG